MKLHDEKVALDLAEAQRAPRSRSVPIRVYHQARLHA